VSICISQKRLKLMIYRTQAYCGTGCQLEFGHCEDTEGKSSPDGTCGGEVGFTCKDSGYGDCCSQYQFCGSSEEFCGTGCLGGFGDCSSNSTSAASNLTATASRHLAPRATSDSTRCPVINETTYTTDCGAEFRLECGFDRINGDAWWSGNGFYVDTLQDCVDACTEWPQCVGVNWVDYHTFGPCYMKTSVTSPFANSGVHGAVMIKNCTNGIASSTPALDKSPFGTPTSTSSTIRTVSSSTASGFATVSTNSAVTTISATTPTRSSGIASSSSSLATASASACANDFTKRQTEIEEECLPCDGQSGSLPYCGADVTTDNYKFTPKTCRTVYYEFDITNATVSPDGVERMALLVNGQMPGPTIEANWSVSTSLQHTTNIDIKTRGDTVIVKVNNRVQDNGTSIHFHGIRQLNNAEYDGVPSITQCPIAPGDSFTYKWVATNYGTSWYHSHYAIQAWMGVFGPMVIHGPPSKQWDVDAGTIFLNDWSHTPVDAMYDAAQDARSGGPRAMENGLINGKNTWGVQGTVNQTGERFELPAKFEPGKTYLFRIINGAIQSSYKFYIDGHKLEVINMDFTNIQPYTTDVVSIEIGQRYMVLVKADQPAGNYWMRADNQNACAATIQADDIKGIVRYSGSNSTAVPTSTKHNYTGGCEDEPLASLIPMAKINPTNSDVSFTKDVTIGANSDFLFKWYLSGTTFMSHYEDPTLVRVLANGTAPTTSGDLILDLPEMGKWVYIIVESAIPLNHPIHLHGHDFFVLAAGSGTYSSSTPLNLVNPPRRDTANMPGGGFLVIAFETDNPGTWLMHCHIGWHTSMGFALQIVEGKSMIGGTVKDKCGLYDTCKKWDDWTIETGFYQHDSGV
jgi:FtsP/CotA-like multicopper oxidase with cupredoxin domain